MTLQQKLNDQQEITGVWARGITIVWPDFGEWKKISTAIKQSVPSGMTERTFNCKWCGVKLKRVVYESDYRPRVCFNCKKLQVSDRNFNDYHSG